MIWLYGICDRPDMPPPRRRGLAQAPVEGIREGELIAVISRHSHPPGDPALDALWVHERVVERIMADRTVLPMRFGTKLPDDEAVRDVLATRRQEFLVALARVRGRVEVGIRAMRPLRTEPTSNNSGPEPSIPVATSGREYLEAKLRDGRRVEREAAALDEPLASLAVAVSRQSAGTPAELLRASYLIEAGVLARFQATVERLQRTHPGVAILCTGPWPPYSFVANATARAAEPTAGGAV